MAGNWRVAEIGASASGGTQACPAEVDLGEGLSVTCGGTDTLDLRSDGSFAGTFRDGSNPAAAAGTATGTWSYDDGSDTIVIAVREIRQDDNGNGQIDQEEITEVDPALRMEAKVREQSADRMTVDLTVDGIFDDSEMRYRSVLVRR
ncbi:MAG TPA: hypothetical protein VM490_12115 [Armatimonadaceae bacterium]|nr:hypothetical protein [Armatimonadaceae bacterium]